MRMGERPNAKNISSGLRAPIALNTCGYLLGERRRHLIHPVWQFVARGARNGTLGIYKTS